MKAPAASPAPLASASRRVGIALAVIGTAMLAGYGIGRTSRETAPASALQWSAGQSTEAGLSASDSRMSAARQSASKDERAKQLARIKARVLELGSKNRAQADWETEREMAALLEQLSAAELGDFFREVSSPLKETGLRLRILEAWALKDGPSAIESTSARLDDWLLAAQAYRAWGAKDPDAALKWLREGELSPYAKQQKFVLRMNFLYDLAEADLEKALNEVPDMDQTEKKRFLERIAALGAEDEARMARLMEFAANADADTRNAIEDGMVLSVGAKDFAKGFESIDGLEASAERKADLEMSVVRAVPKEKLAESMDAWAARHADGGHIPERMWEMLGERLIFYREEMRAWLEDMEPGPVRDAFYQQSVRHFVSGGERDKALRYINLIEDPGQRATALQTMHRMWSENDPVAARTWAEGLPDEDRQALQLQKQ